MSQTSNKLLSVLGPVGNLIGQGINAFTQGTMNRKTRKWSEKMYERQRADSLADYHMQNQYNSPAQQMARLREAGLNPNLVYGNGADATGGVVRSTSMTPWKPEPPRFDPGSAMAQYVDTRMKEAQIDNLKAQNDAISADATLKTNTAAKVLIDTAKTEQEKQQAAELFPYQIEATKAQTDRTLKETDVLIRRDTREAMQNSSNLQEALQRMAESRSRVVTDSMRREVMQIEKKLKTLELDLNKGLKPLGLTAQDGVLWRLAAVALQKLLGRSPAPDPAKNYGGLLPRLSPGEMSGSYDADKRQYQKEFGGY